jgi:hypothetical protein
MAAASGKVVWVGRVISILVSLVFVMSSTMKFLGGPQVTEGTAKLGLQESLVLPLAILELSCAVIYLIPPTAILGAILLTGYLGGAILTHLRIGEQQYPLHVIIGVLVWLGLWLRENRLRALIPLRRR